MCGSACSPSATQTIGTPCGPPASKQANLSGAVAVSSSDVWAVGLYQDLGPAAPLAEHWDGSQWTEYDPPAGLSNAAARLNGVSVASPNDVWAVGSKQGTGDQQTLTEHWDGTAWRVIPSPNAGDRTNYLAGVAAVSTRDVWAVGYYYDADRVLVLTEHWDGKSWSLIQGANPAVGMNTLTAVSATSATDVWAVGMRRDSDSLGPQGLVERWDGHAWSVVSSPAGWRSSSLSATTSSLNHDIWAVGSYDNGTRFQPLIERWDGASLKAVPNPQTLDVSIQAAAERDSSDVWAAGSSSHEQNEDWFIEHWNGQTWRTTAPASGATGAVNAMSTVASNDVWAVGNRRVNGCGPEWALIQHWNGTVWAYVSSPHDGHSES